MSGELEFEVPTWEEIYELLLNLADKIRRDNFKPDVIVGISRGGWPPARIMSDLLESPELANVKAEFYLGVAKTKGEPVITQPVSVSVMGKKALIVDDVADTGKSLRLVRSHLQEHGATEVKIATIYYKPWSITFPDWYERKTSHWIIFPWERKETLRNVVEKCRSEGESIEEAKEKLVRSGLDRKLVERFIREISEEED
ncbi:MAG: xanthine-guanine phosphoribosyltransferase [Candidatus Bathyarchaeota archaeon BA1]|nr:MAG: xanthine-guanine phosphoribosyltransferase [Candidatus Bathyarchaeota archaeon BA1]